MQAKVFMHAQSHIYVYSNYEIHNMTYSNLWIIINVIFIHGISIQHIGIEFPYVT